MNAIQTITIRAFPVLFALNLIPIPLLGGGRILSVLVPIRFSDILSRIEPIGMFVAFGLPVIGVLSLVLNPSLQYLVFLIGKLYELHV